MASHLILLSLLVPVAVGDTVADSLAQEQAALQEQVRALEAKATTAQRSLRAIEARTKKESQRLDTLVLRLEELQGAVAATRKEGRAELAKLGDSQVSYAAQSEQTRVALSQRTWIGFSLALLLLVALAAVGIWLVRRQRRSGESIEGIRKAQDELRAAQAEAERAQEKLAQSSKRLEQSGLELDKRLLELLERQSQESVSTSGPAGAPDHSLALKMADEVVRINKNLQKIDPEGKNLKPLVKSIERIKSNFAAKGYEIVDMLGQRYDEGMNVQADFIEDTELPAGTAVITRVLKPQVNYEGKLIQKAHIEVSVAG